MVELPEIICDLNVLPGWRGCGVCGCARLFVLFGLDGENKVVWAVNENRPIGKRAGRDSFSARILILRSEGGAIESMAFAG